jgi:protein-S-isoprenylcysteine O-methyltransferase Ste14
MALHKHEQPTASSPPPQVITPTVSLQPEEAASPQSEITNDSTSTEIKAPLGVVPGIPLSQLKDEVTAQQSTTHPDTTPENNPSKSYELVLVVLQILALFVIIVGFIPPILWQITFLQVTGMLLIGLALFIAVWTVISFKQRMRILPSPDPQGFLVTGGPYAFIRHPMYFSLVLGSVGLTLAYPTIPRIIALLVLVFVLYSKISIEEKMLAERFNGYDKYKLHTGALFPKFHTDKHASLAQPPESSKEEM